MRRSWVLILVCALIGACSAGSFAGALLQFNVQARGSGKAAAATVVGRGQVLLTLRGSGAAAKAQSVADRLSEVALSSASAADFVVTRQPTAAVIKCRGTVILAVDKAAGRLAGSDFVALAQGWRNNIAAAFAEPYLALRISGPVIVPVGEQRAVRWGGAVEPVASSTSPEVITPTVSLGERKVYLKSTAAGQATVTLSAADAQVSIPAIARQWAARIASDVSGQLTGHDLPESLREQAALNTALANVKPQPGAVVQVRRFWSSGGKWSAVVEATGDGYLPVKKQVNINLDWTAPPERSVGVAMISNVPEKVTGPGLLMREELPTDQGARLLWHHVNRSEARLQMTCQIVNPTPNPARVHLTWAQAGPGSDEIYLGHAALSQFWREVSNGCGYVAYIPPLSSWIFSQQEFAPNQIVSGMAQLQVMEGGGLIVETQARNANSPVRFFEPVSPTAYEKPNLSRASFPGSRNVQIQHTCGGPWTFYHIGKSASSNGNGEELAGDYGVLQDIGITISNPQAEPAYVELAIEASGGAARGIFKLDGELIETGLLRPNQELTLCRLTVPAGRDAHMRMLTIPQSGSNYPITVVVRTIK